MYDIKIYESGQEKETIRGLSIAQASALQKVLDRYDIAHRVKRIEAAQPAAVCDCKLPGFDANNPGVCPTCGKPHRPAAADIDEPATAEEIIRNYNRAVRESRRR